eukprot:CAMPEP_0183707000 /NCGR_PEP_ID=MMETSP0737-20130205/3704_1 /TAXON_ID=385413 /ORGANISM="Thalassiosira miniscula, Strain CCMP1093" /LENGTH=254 /DNA_ID=CAMNT_0025934567 /DNA_START=198 /DNA_END=962 /DNA_ORIENTATION=+
MNPLPTTKDVDDPSSSSYSPNHKKRRHQSSCNKPTPYLIITNISKRQNVKNLLQLAAAYGCHTIFVVGQRAFEFDILPGDNDDGGKGKKTDIPTMIQQHMRNGRMKIVKFDKLEECVDYIKSLPYDGDDYDAADDGASSPADNDVDGDATMNAQTTATMKQQKRKTIPIIGVEIDNSAKNLEDEPFHSSVAFMMGNEGSGMSSKQMAACDGFIRISQYGGGTASLNVSVAAGLVLHRYFHWSRGDGVVRRYCDE